MGNRNKSNKHKHSTADIEESLREQRCRVTAVISSNLNLTNTNESFAGRSIPGYDFNPETNRYYKRAKEALTAFSVNNQRNVVHADPGRKTPLPISIISKPSLIDLMMTREIAVSHMHKHHYFLRQHVLHHSLQVEEQLVPLHSKVIGIVYNPDYGSICFSQDKMYFLNVSLWGMTNALDVFARPDLFADPSFKFAKWLCTSIETRDHILAIVSSTAHQDVVQLYRFTRYPYGQRRKELCIFPSMSMSTDRSSSHNQGEKSEIFSIEYLDLATKTLLAKIHCIEVYNSYDIMSAPLFVIKTNSPASCLETLHHFAVVPSNGVAPIMYLTGHRNGQIHINDLRQRNARGNLLAAFPTCIDHMRVLSESASLLALDLSGKMTLFDLRRPMQPVCDITPSSSQVRSRKFFLLPSHDRAEATVAFVHPAHVSVGVGIYSIQKPNHLLHTVSYPEKIVSQFQVINRTSCSSVGTSLHMRPFLWSDMHVTMAVNYKYSSICDRSQYSYCWQHLDDIKVSHNSAMIGFLASPMKSVVMSISTTHDSMY